MEITQTGPQSQSSDTTRVLPPQSGELAAPVTAGDVTQMAANVRCPVCMTMNSSLETYCVECGFLLSSSPGADLAPEPETAEACALVEERSGRRFPLHVGVNLVGRENGDVLLMEPTVSRRHAEIEVTGGGTEVRDLGSTNGTQVDGVPVVAGTGVRIRNGSTVRFGNAVFRFEGPGGGAEPTVAVAAQGDETAEAPVAAPIARLRALDPAVSDILVGLGTTTIGRRPGNTHVLANDPYVSGRHASIETSWDGVRITDVGSTNGTRVNGTRLAPNMPTTLAPGDEIAIGQSRFVFEEIEPQTSDLLDEEESADTAEDISPEDGSQPLDEEDRL